MRKLLSIAFVMLSVLAIAFVPAYGATDGVFLKLTFHGEDGAVSLNGGPAVNSDLTVELYVDTDNLLPGVGFAGSDRYANLKAFFSSTSLGLHQVEATNPLSVDIGTPGLGAPFTNSTVLLFDGSQVNGLFYSSAIATWDRVSAIGPLFMPATASGPLSVTLANGNTLSISNFDNAVPYADSYFQAETLDIDQLYPCEGPWKNHGQYVSAVSHAAEDFVTFGLITEAEKDAIVSEAAQSSCGKKK